MSWEADAECFAASTKALADANAGQISDAKLYILSRYVVVDACSIKFRALNRLQASKRMRL